MKEIRKLKAHEVDVRVGQVPKSGKGFSLLLYKDARVDRAILDEVYGAENWQNDFEVINNNLFASVSIWSEEKKCWVTKKDVGTESNTEKQKGEASDAFKRACFKLGIGNELYNAPFIWVKGYVQNNKPTIRNFKVEKMEIDDNYNFTDLIIMGEINYKWEMIYSLRKPSPDLMNAINEAESELPIPEDKPKQQSTNNNELKDKRKKLIGLVTLYCQETGNKPQDIYQTFNITKESNIATIDVAIKGVQNLRTENNNGID